MGKRYEIAANKVVGLRRHWATQTYKFIVRTMQGVGEGRLLYWLRFHIAPDIISLDQTMPIRKTARRDKVEIYLHLIWTTWDRLPLISSDWEEEMFAVIHTVIEQNQCTLLAVGGVEDHVHVLVGIRATTRTSDLVKSIKGTSASFGMKKTEFFKWRPTYAAFSVSRWDINKLRNYINNQKIHHAENSTSEILECFDEEYFVDDETHL